MKRLLAVLLCAALLTGCSLSQKAEELTGRMRGFLTDLRGAEEASAPAQPAPTAQPAVLRICWQAENAAVRAAVEEYAAARGITLETADSPQEADLLLSAQDPGEDGTDLSDASFGQLAAAIAESGAAEGCRALCVGADQYGWQADGAMLESLLGDAGQDLQACSWAEFDAFARAVEDWIEQPGEQTVTLNGNEYTLAAAADENTLLLEAVFTAEADDCGGPLFTPALLAAGEEPTQNRLTGPLNSVYQTLTLEATSFAEGGAQALADGKALFYRGTRGAVAALDAECAGRLTTLAVKFSFESSDFAADSGYTAEQLLTQPVAQGGTWLSIPAPAAQTEGGRQARGFLLWALKNGRLAPAQADGLPAAELSGEQVAALNEAWQDASQRWEFVYAAAPVLLQG